MAPAVHDGVVAVTSANIVYGLDARSRAVLWKQEVRRQVEGSDRRRKLSAPRIVGNRVCRPTPAEQSRRRIRSAGGQLFFTANFEEPNSTGNRQGFLYALDPRTGQVKWKHRVNRPSQYSDPANRNTSEFIVNVGTVYCENFQFIAKIRY